MLFGMAGSRLVLPLGNSAMAVDAQLRRFFPSLAIIALLSAVALIGAMAANMAGDWSAAVSGGILAKVLGGTSFGQVWIGRFVLLVLLMAAMLISRHGIWTALFATLATASLGLVGHAAMA